MEQEHTPRGFLDLSAQYDMLPAGSRVLCAVSGGADSMCLLHLLERYREPWGLTVYAAHFNHHLRGAESQRDADFVAGWCAGHGIPCAMGGGDVAGEAARLGLGVEEAARQLRYRFLEEEAARLDCTRIATAHHAGDNLETLLLHLIRGAGLHGLAGIPPRRGKVVRPLLACSRAELLAYLEANGIPHVEDSTNTDSQYARNCLRQQVIPVLQALNPRLMEHAAQAMGYLRTDDSYLNALAGEAIRGTQWRGDSLILDAGCLARLPDALAPRAARLLLEQTGGGSTDCSAAHLNAIVALARSGEPSGQVSLPGGRLARREYGSLVLTRGADPPSFSPRPLTPDGDSPLAGSPWRVRCRPVSCPEQGARTPGAIYLARAALGEDALLRPRQTGDRIALPGRGTKTIKKLFIDARIPRWEREAVPVLADSRGVAAVAGFGGDCTRLARPGEAAYELLLWKEV